MKRPLQLLCSAQHFGFGPMAELLALERALRHQGLNGASARLQLQCNQYLTSLLGADQDRFDLFDGIAGALPIDSLLSNPSLKDADAIISSYDSAAVFFGWFTHRPVFLYDGLFWFWKFDPFRHKVPEYLDLLHRIRQRQDARAFAAVYRELLECDYHLTVLVSHYLCTAAYVRNGTGTASRLAEYPELADRTHIIGAVIDPTMSAAQATERTHILVSLSGSLAPLLSFDQNLAYARGALMYALEAFAVLDIRLPWYFCCHPRLYDALAADGRLNGLPRDFIVVASFDYSTNLDMIRRAFALFISPGFSSIQEAAYFRTPVFFLPEQNGGQPAQLLMLRGAGYDASNSFTTTDVICGGKATIGEDDVDLLYAGIGALWSERMHDVRIELLNEVNAIVQSPQALEKRSRSQTSAVTAVFGDFDGASYVAKHVLHTLHSYI